MGKRLAVLIASITTLVVCAAVQASPNDTFGNLRTSSVRMGALGLADSTPFSLSSAFVAPDPVVANFLPALPPVADSGSLSTAHVSAAFPIMGDYSKDGKDISPVEHHRMFDYATGEVGFIYGASTGKFSSDFEAGYIQGTVGNEHLQISAGASYENYNQKLPHWGR